VTASSKARAVKIETDPPIGKEEIGGLVTLASVPDVRDVPGYGGYFRLSGRDCALLVMAHFAVAAVATAGSPRRVRRLLEPFESLLSQGRDGGSAVEDFAAAVLANSHRWRAELAARGADCTPETLRLLAISLCTRPLMIAAGGMVESTTQRRMDAILDLWDVECSSVELQQTHFETVQALWNPDSFAGWKFAASGGRPYAEMLQWAHPSVGATAAYRLHHADGADCVEHPAITAVARAVMACRFAFEGAEQLEQARRVRELLFDQLSAEDEPDAMRPAATEGLSLLAEFAPAQLAAVPTGS
jgi:hypothetical protein